MPQPYHTMPYSTPSMRYNLRMRPFLSISLPDVPSFPEFSSLVSLRGPEKDEVQSPDLISMDQTDIRQQALSILEVADQALKFSRKQWEAVSKVNPETAHCLGCEDWWGTSIKNVLRSCITANIMVATAKKAMVPTEPKSTQGALNVEIPESNQGYHPWWIVPRINSK